MLPRRERFACNDVLGRPADHSSRNAEPLRVVPSDSTNFDCSGSGKCCYQISGVQDSRADSVCCDVEHNIADCDRVAYAERERSYSDLELDFFRYCYHAVWQSDSQIACDSDRVDCYSVMRDVRRGG